MGAGRLSRDCHSAAPRGGSTQRAGDAVNQARRADQRADAIAAVPAAPDSRTRAAGLSGGAVGTVVVSHQEDKTVFLASGMARPAYGRVYPLWFDDGGSMPSAGLMDPGRTEQAVLLRGAPEGASGVGVTVGAAGGSPRPTTAPPALIGLPA